MAILYQTAKFKSANILAIVILGSTAKFNSRQYFQLYSIYPDRVYRLYDMKHTNHTCSVLLGPNYQIYIYNAVIICSCTYMHLQCTCVLELQLAALLGKSLLKKNNELEQNLRKLQEFAEETVSANQVSKRSKYRTKTVINQDKIVYINHASHEFCAIVFPIWGVVSYLHLWWT